MTRTRGTIIGMDTAKRVFQLHAFDTETGEAEERKLSRVRLLPAARVRPFARGNKNDVHDARAICTAAQQPGIRPVPVKSAEQQAVLGLHRARRQLVKFRTSQINGLRAGIAVASIRSPGRFPKC